jgi:hypothetical protein
MAASDFLTGVAQSPQTNQGGASTLSMTQTGAVRVSTTEPQHLDYTRNGQRFYLGNNAACTGIAPIQALATTAAQWGLTNPSTSGKVYVFDTIGLWLISGTAGTTGNVGTYTIYTTTGAASIKSGLAIQNCDGSTAASAMLANSGLTVSVPAAPVWIPFSGNESLGSAVDSLVLVDDKVEGRIILQPGYTLGLNASGAAGSTPLFAPFARWYECAMTVV